MEEDQPNASDTVDAETHVDGQAEASTPDLDQSSDPAPIRRPEPPLGRTATPLVAQEAWRAGMEIRSP